jgi:hypothetical protein
MKRVYVTVWAIAFCLGCVNQAAADPISQSTAATLCNRYGGGFVFQTSGDASCSFCTAKTCYFIACWPDHTCAYSSFPAAKAGPVGGNPTGPTKPTNSTPIVTGKPIEAAPSPPGGTNPPKGTAPIVAAPITGKPIKAAPTAPSHPAPVILLKHDDNGPPEHEDSERGGKH